jgi:glycerol uptake facilitator-like aquaporin
LPVYFIVQLLGAIAGAFIVYFNYRLAIVFFTYSTLVRVGGILESLYPLSGMVGTWHINFKIGFDCVSVV